MSNATNFATKNRLRKENYEGTSEHRRARDLRRAIGGAFGNETKDLHNKMVLGTSGALKEGVKS